MVGALVFKVHCIFATLLGDVGQEAHREMVVAGDCSTSHLKGHVQLELTDRPGVVGSLRILSRQPGADFFPSFRSLPFFAVLRILIHSTTRRLDAARALDMSAPIRYTSSRSTIRLFRKNTSLPQYFFVTNTSRAPLSLLSSQNERGGPCGTKTCSWGQPTGLKPCSSK